MKVFCKISDSLLNAPFHFPKGCGYTAPNVNTQSFSNCNESVNKIFKGKKEVFFVCTDEKKYVLVVPTTDEETDLENIKLFYGRQFGMFEKGVVRIVVTDFNFTKNFNRIRNFILGEEYEVRKNGREYLFTAMTDNCMLDDDFIDPADFVGEKVVLCEACQEDRAAAFVAAIKKAFELTADLNKMKSMIPNEYMDSHITKKLGEARELKETAKKVMKNLISAISELPTDEFDKPAPPETYFVEDPARLTIEFN